MKRKGRILATILAISMLASIASTTAFAASPAIPSSALGEAAQDRIVSSMEQVDIAAVGETQYLVIGVESASVEKPALFFLCDDETVAELSNTFVASVGDLQYVPGYNDLSDAEKLELQTQSIGNYVVTVTGLKQGTTVINVLTEGNLTLDIPVNVAQVQGPHLNVNEVTVDKDEEFTIELLNYEGEPNNLMWQPIDENGNLCEGDPDTTPIEIIFPDGIVTAPVGSMVTIRGVRSGETALSCLDMSKVDMEAAENATTEEEIAAILKPAILATCHLNVVIHMSDIIILADNPQDQLHIDVNIKEPIFRIASAYPLEATDKQPLLFSSDNEQIATITSVYINNLDEWATTFPDDYEDMQTAIGFIQAMFPDKYFMVVTGINPGTTTLHITSQDGRFSKDISVTVTEQAE